MQSGLPIIAPASTRFYREISLNWMVPDGAFECRSLQLRVEVDVGGKLETLFGSMSHLRAGGVCAFRHELKSDRRSTMRALASNGFFVEQFVFMISQPHELKALRAATDLRCHAIPRTLRTFRPQLGGYSSTRCPPASRPPLHFRKRKNLKRLSCCGSFIRRLGRSTARSKTPRRCCVIPTSSYARGIATNWWDSAVC